MIVLSLFDGMSCGQIALKELGINISKYYASEIKKSAIYTTKLNFPNTIQLGDINNWREWDLNWNKIDLLLAGSPCQDFSLLNRVTRGLEGSKSSLFYKFMEIKDNLINSNNNAKWLLENVTNGTNSITQLLKTTPIFVNNREFSWCNRNRYFWTNLKTSTHYNLFGEKFFVSNIPNSTRDRGFRFREITKNQPIKKVSPKMLKIFHRPKATGFHYIDILRKGVGKCITTSPFGGSTNVIIYDEKDWRYLTISEMKDAHNIPGWYDFGRLSCLQIYNLIGDGWGIGSVKHILKHLK